MIGWSVAHESTSHTASSCERSPYASGKPPVAKTQCSFVDGVARIQRSAVRVSDWMPPPMYGDGNSENPTMSMGERGDEAHAKRVLSSVRNEEAATPTRTWGSRLFASFAAAVRYDSHS